MPKFRAWNDKEGMCSGQRLAELELNLTFNGAILFDNFAVETLRWKLMQNTGLKDKNGVEIYEGDIVKIHKGILVVSYRAPSFIMRQKIKSGYSKSWHTFDLHPSENQFAEVIGNIYENPERLG